MTERIFRHRRRDGLSRRAFIGAAAAFAAPPALARDAAAPPRWRPGIGEPPRDVRIDRDWLVGRFATREGLRYEARQRLSGLSGTAVAVDPRPMEMFLFSGQSNAGGSPVVASLPTTRSPFVEECWFPQHVFTTDAWTGSYGDKPIVESRITDLIPAGDRAQYGVLPQTTFMLALEALDRAEGRLGPGYGARTDWWGGQPLDVLLKGGVQFENTLASARVLARQAAAYDRRSRVGALLFVHGESRGRFTRESYAAALTRHFASLREALPQQHGDRPLPALFTQINQGTALPAPSGIELAQLDAPRAAGAPNWLCGPMYQLPLAVEVRSGRAAAIHQNIAGKMMLGELLAVAYRRIRDTGSFDPLRPRAAALQGETLTLDLDVPAGARLAIDSDWITARPSGYSGFAVEAGTERIAVTGMRIEGASRVALRLARPVADGAAKLRYALDPQPVDLSRAAAGDACFAPSTGLLMAETDILSPFAQRGFPVPKRIRHYCVRFSLAVA